MRKAHAPALEKGFAARGGRPADWDLAAIVPVVVDDDVQACRDLLKPLLALYIGGMGSRDQNFYNRLARRYGFEAAATTIQDLYLDGKKGEAAIAVPDALVDEIALVGDRHRIAGPPRRLARCGGDDVDPAGASDRGAPAPRGADAVNRRVWLPLPEPTR